MPTMQPERIQISDRARGLRSSSTLAVTAMVNAMKARGIDVIGFGAGQPDFDTPANIKQAAISALEAGLTKYMPTPGTNEAREAIARKLRDENGIDCASEHVVITVGAKHAMYMALQVIVNPGDEVILPTPAWVSYAPMIELAGGRVVELPAALDNDFKIRPRELADAITPRTAAIILNSPSNPCGTMYAEEELRALAEVLADGPGVRVQIITDEIYEKIIFGGIEHFSIGSLPPVVERVVTINGLSKAYAMTGWRIGYLCSPGSGGAVAKAVTKLQDQMTSNITSFCYAAIVEALTNGAESVERMRQQFAKRAKLMHSLVSRMPDLRCPAPTGAFYLFPDISSYFGRSTKAGRRISSAESFAQALLEEARVAVVPGEDFGQCARSHVRLSFACSEDHIREGCHRLDEWLRGLR